MLAHQPQVSLKEMEVLYHDENSNSAECKQQGHGDKAVSVNHSGNQ